MLAFHNEHIASCAFLTYFSPDSTATAASSPTAAPAGVTPAATLLTDKPAKSGFSTRGLELRGRRIGSRIAMAVLEQFFAFIRVEYPTIDYDVQLILANRYHPSEGLTISDILLRYEQVKGIFFPINICAGPNVMTKFLSSVPNVTNCCNANGTMFFFLRVPHNPAVGR